MSNAGNNKTNNNKLSGDSWQVYLVFAIAINVICYFAASAKGSSISIWSMLLCIPFSFIGATIGNYLRKFAMPSSIITRGGFWAIIQAKIFWQIGPQFIGGIIPIIFAILGAIGK